MNNVKVNCVKKFLFKGHCDINAVDKTKRTPLIMCVGQGHQQMMELLIAAGRSLLLLLIQNIYPLTNRNSQVF